MNQILAGTAGLAFPAGKATAVVTCHRHVPKSRLSSHESAIKKMAGTAGLEPANGGVKVLCLTAWLRPNVKIGRFVPLYGQCAAFAAHCQGFSIWGE